MLRLTFEQLLRRRGRTLAVISAIVVAAVSFSLLSSAVATSKIQVRGTIEENYRSAYDILVRPKDSATDLEASEQLVRQNFLSDTFGGISMKQYRAIADIPGVEVAAPIAMVGYVLPEVSIKTGVDKEARADPATEQLYRMRQTWTTDRGLSHYPAAGVGAQLFYYVTRAPVTWKPGIGLPFVTDPVTGKQVLVCGKFPEHLPVAESAFDRDADIALECASTRPSPGENADLNPEHKPTLRRRNIDLRFFYQFPMLVAAIDPVQEAKLVGIDDAVTSGRYLTEHESPSRSCPYGRRGVCHRNVPMLMADHPVIDEHLKITWERLQPPDPGLLPHELIRPKAAGWMRNLPATEIKTHRYHTAAIYRRLLRAYADPLRDTGNDQYWSAGPVTYTTDARGHLRPKAVENPAETWIQPLYGDNPWEAPAAARDVGFRPLHVHIASNQASGNMLNVPSLWQVGTFDPDQLESFGELSQVPLTTYYPPQASPGDARTRELLGGRSLLPNGNLAGYLQQPPLILTSLQMLPALRDSAAFTDLDSVQGPPISAIRIRVAGVNGIDEESQARVRLVAEQILRRTGLDVDITVGSSPTSELVDLPAGNYGRPELTLEEGWVRKDVAVSLLSAIDTKSLALFGLVLLVCLMYLVNATVASVQSRRAELGVLACLGWPTRKITGLLLAELVVLGLVAGFLGTLAALLITGLAGLSVTWWQLLLITPVATVLAVVAGVWPAVRAGRVSPLEAMYPSVRLPSKASPVRSIPRMAASGVTRWRGRSLLGATSLLVAVAAFTVLIAIQRSFNGTVTNSALGDAVALQVRGVDYFAAAMILVLAGFGIADVAYLNIVERTQEIGTLRACAWRESHVRRLFGTEAMLIAVLGTVGGAVLSATLVLTLLPEARWQTVAGAGAAATGAGLMCALLAVLIPLSRLSQLAPAAAISAD